MTVVSQCECVCVCVTICACLFVFLTRLQADRKTTTNKCNKNKYRNNYEWKSWQEKQTTFTNIHHEIILFLFLAFVGGS